MGTPSGSFSSTSTKWPYVSTNSAFCSSARQPVTGFFTYVAPDFRRAATALYTAANFGSARAASGISTSPTGAAAGAAISTAGILGIPRRATASVTWIPGYLSRTPR